MRLALTTVVFAGWASLAQPAQAQETIAEITPADLSIRLHAFAHDSMQGRLTGTEGHTRAVKYIVRELERLQGSQPRAWRVQEQRIPFVLSRADPSTAVLAVLDRRLTFGVDFLPVPGSIRAPFPRQANVRTHTVIHGGRVGAQDAPDSLTKDAFVLLDPPLRADGHPDFRVWDWAPMLSRYRDAAAVGIIGLELLPITVRNRLAAGEFDVESRSPVRTTPPVVLLSRGGAASLMRGDPSRVAVARDRRAVTLEFSTRRQEVEAPAANVVALIEGVDPELRSEYVVLNAHIDHLGLATGHDAVGGDTVFNGADVGGSGSMALLEVAEHLASHLARPRRSIAFVWTTGTVQGGIGAEWFLNSGLVPVERIVASISLGAIGLTPTYDVGSPCTNLNAARSHRMSAELASLIREANARTLPQLALRYSLYEPNQRASTRCADGAAAFGRAGIPSVFLSAEPHPDHNRVSDEAEQIDYESLARVAAFLASVASDVADRFGRPSADSVATRRRLPGAGDPRRAR